MENYQINSHIRRDQARDSMSPVLFNLRMDEIIEEVKPVKGCKVR